MTGPQEQSEPVLPAQRTESGPRHAAPRVRGRGRARLLAFAVPTALLVGSSLPSLAAAVTPSGKACASSPDNTTTVTPVPKSKITPVPAPTKAALSGTAGHAVSAAFVTPNVPANAPPNVPANAPANVPAGAPTQQAAAVTSQVVQAAAVQPGTAQSQGLIGDIVGGIAGIFDPTHQNTQSTPAPAPAAAPQVGAPVTPSTPAASPSAAPSTAAPSAPATSAAPSTAAPSAHPTPSSSAPSTPAPGASPSTAPSPAAPGSTPSASAGPSGNSSPSASAAAPAKPTAVASPSDVAKALANGDSTPNCAVDTRALAAGAAQGGQVVPDQSWTLHTSRLSLYGAVFGGVYEVHSPTRTYRVLKFTVSSVDIENLDMSTIEDTAAGGNPAQTFHVKGGPGTTSTMRQGPINMYVESLSGDLASLYGIPLPDLGAITLTPDTLPQWLYNLIGAIPIPIDMALTKVKAVQAGQFGGTLHIPGMHMYNDTTPYDGL